MRIIKYHRNHDGQIQSADLRITPVEQTMLQMKHVKMIYTHGCGPSSNYRQFTDSDRILFGGANFVDVESKFKADFCAFRAEMKKAISKTV